MSTGLVPLGPVHIEHLLDAHRFDALHFFFVENQRHTVALNMYCSVSTARCLFVSYQNPNLSKKNCFLQTVQTDRHVPRVTGPFLGLPLPVWQAPPTQPSGQLQIPGATQLPPFLQPWGHTAAIATTPQVITRLRPRQETTLHRAVYGYTEKRIQRSPQTHIT